LVELSDATGTGFAEPPIRGSAENIAATLRDYARAGSSQLQLRIDPNSGDGVRPLELVMALLDES
jgi:hypothetical protein